MGNRRLRTGESQGIVWVQCSRGGIFVAYCALVLWKVCELPTPIVLDIALLAVRAKTKYRACRRRNQGMNRGQWVQYGVRSCAGETAEFAMGEEGKEEHEEFRKCVPHHLAVHELVADIASYESPGRNELHAQ